MRQAIKVLMIVKEFEIQGIREVILNYVENINYKKFQIDVLAGDQYDKGNLKRLKACGGKFWCVKGRDKNILAYIYQLSRIIKREGYDIVHVHGNSAMITPELVAAKLGGAPVRIAHSHNITCNHPWLDKILHPLFSSLYTNALACSEEAGKWMFKNHSFDIINNGIDTSKYVFDNENRKKLRAKLGIKNEILIGHVGSFNQQKNQKRLLEIFETICKSCKNVKLIFVGDGERRSEIEKLAKVHGLADRVIFFGQCQSTGAILSAMDLFVFPSLYEGFGLALLEAQVSGLACIASDMVPQEANVTGYVQYLSLSDPNEIWKETIYLEASKMENLQNRMARSKEACKILMIKKYEIRSVTKQLELLYDKTLAVHLK